MAAGFSSVSPDNGPLLKHSPSLHLQPWHVQRHSDWPVLIEFGEQGSDWGRGWRGRRVSAPAGTKMMSLPLGWGLYSLEHISHFQWVSSVSCCLAWVGGTQVWAETFAISVPRLCNISSERLSRIPAQTLTVKSLRTFIKIVCKYDFRVSICHDVCVCPKTSIHPSMSGNTTGET